MEEKLSYTDVISNAMDCLQRAQERIKELGEVSPDLPTITDDMTLVDDIEKSLEDLAELESVQMDEKAYSVDINNKDLPVQFAVLWGMEMADARADEKRYQEMQGYDSQELYQLFQGWGNEYLQSEYDDTVAFFEEKLDGLMEKCGLSKEENKESIVPGTKFLIVSATAEYTGGGMYIYHGKLSDGNYFRTCDDWESIEITNSDASVEAADYQEFYDEHIVETVIGEDYKTFWNTMLNKIIIEKPKGNYDVRELEDRLFVSTKNIVVSGIDELISGGKEIYLKATNIEWDVDSEEDKEFLPTEIDLPDWIKKDDYDAIEDYLSNETGFCHKGYVLEVCEKKTSLEEKISEAKGSQQKGVKQCQEKEAERV